MIARVGEARQAVHPEWQRPLTHTTIEVEEVLVGKAPANLTIEQLGGVLDGQVHYVPGDAVLKAGERCLLFLRNVDGGWFLTAMQQSKYELLEGERGTFVKRAFFEGLFVNTPEGLKPFAPPRKRPVQLLSIGLMWIGAGDDARTARAAGANGEKGVCELHTPSGQTIEVGCTDVGITGETEIIPRKIIGNHEHDVWSHVRFAKRN